jgi:hypothetical protein
MTKSLEMGELEVRLGLLCMGSDEESIASFCSACQELARSPMALDEDDHEMLHQAFDCAHEDQQKSEIESKSSESDSMIIDGQSETVEYS